MNLDTIIANIVTELSLNQKQKVAFRLAVTNVVEREWKEEVKQIIPYIGGLDGIGKSEVIKAIAAFHEELKLMHQLKFCSYTGMPAKNITGSIILSLAGLRNVNFSKLGKKWDVVKTVLLDETSMVGCRLLAKFRT